MPEYPQRTKEILSQVGAKFLLVVDRVIEEGKAKTEWDFTKSIKIRQPQLNDIRIGKRFITVEMLFNTIMKYNVNPSYLFPPFSKNMFLKENKKEQIKQKKIQLEQIKKEIKILETFSD